MIYSTIKIVLVILDIFTSLKLRHPQTQHEAFPSVSVTLRTPVCFRGVTSPLFDPLSRLRLERPNLQRHGRQHIPVGARDSRRERINRAHKRTAGNRLLAWAGAQGECSVGDSAAGCREGEAIAAVDPDLDGLPRGSPLNVDCGGVGLLGSRGRGVDRDVDDLESGGCDCGWKKRKE